MRATWEPGLGDHLRTIWRYRWPVLAGAFAIAGLVFAARSAVAETYRSTAKVLLTVNAGDGIELDEDRAQFASRIVTELAESGDERVDIEWSHPPGFIEIGADASSAGEARDLADDAAREVVDLAQGLRGESLSATIVEPADEPVGPVSPAPAREALAAFVVSAIVLAEGAALWRPARGLLPLTRTAERVNDLVGVPALTLTGDADDRTRLALFVARFLADKPAALVVQTKGEPLPAAALRLAEAAAVGGRRSLVVDGDVDQPVLHTYLGLPRGPGLAEVVSGDRSLGDTVFASPTRTNLWLLTGGGRSDNGRRAPVGQRALDRVGVEDRFDFVAVTLGAGAPPDGLAGAVANLRGSTILVIDPVRTKRHALSELVHGFGGQDDVAAVLLMTDAVAQAETNRLAARWRRSSAGT